jgi:hypothetical protein
LRRCWHNRLSHCTPAWHADSGSRPSRGTIDSKPWQRARRTRQTRANW